MSVARRLLPFLALSLLAACGKDKGGSGSPDIFTTFDMDARKAAWQGAWALPYTMEGSIGGWSAIEIAGDKGKVFVGGADVDVRVLYDSPCNIGLERKKDDGSTETWNIDYVLKDGQIWAGLGGAGAVKGKVVAACDHPWGVYISNDGTCTLWKEGFDGKWDREAATCGFEKNAAGADVFAWKTPVGDNKESLEQMGDVLIDQQLRDEHGEKVADYAAAKALITTKAAQ